MARHRPYNRRPMLTERPHSTAMLALSLLIGLAAAWAPAKEAAMTRDVLERSRSHTDSGDATQPESDDEQPKPTIIKSCCEWDRTARLPSPVLISRQLTPLAAGLHVHHLVERFEIVRHILLAEPILWVAGPYRNHAPHGPPFARV
ncbi:MAG: hypothetical protein ACE5GE_12930 [Phycisphaerae bacterium]